jgi:hypothetical protein
LYRPFKRAVQAEVKPAKTTTDGTHVFVGDPITRECHGVAWFVVVPDSQRQRKGWPDHYRGPLALMIRNGNDS